MKKSRSGFTFVELIVAITIFSVIAVSIYSTFMAGMRVWSRANPVIEANQGMRVFFDTFSRDAKNAFRFETGDDAVNFDGGQKSASFWSIIDVSGEGVPFHREIARVEYRMDDASKAIMRNISTRDGGFVFTKESSVTLLKDVDPMQFSIKYCYKKDGGEDEIEWKDSWDDGKNIPIGLRVQVGDFRKTIFIPTGKPGESAIQ